ncbi:MAG: ATP-binding cassette, subfamily bacterial [Actinomycetota bacterium]|nr:ATP-binding cassette, subfamily bacterial [Actinomycetota bacterium]
MLSPDDLPDLSVSTRTPELLPRAAAVLFPALRAGARWAALSLVFLMPAAMVPAVLPWFTAGLTDRVLQGRPAEAAGSAAVMVGLTLVGALLEAAAGCAAAVAALRVGRHLRERLVTRMCRTRPPQAADAAIPELLTIFGSDIPQMEQGLTIAIGILPSAVVGVVAAWAMSARADPRAAAVLVAASLASGAVVAWLARKCGTLHAAVQHRREVLMLRQSEQVNGLRVLRGLGAETHAVHAVTVADLDLTVASVSARVLAASLGPAASVMLQFALATILAMIASARYEGQLSPGRVAALVTWAAQALSGAASASFTVAVLVPALVGAVRIADWLEHAQEAPAPDPGGPQGTGAGLCLESVHGPAVTCVGGQVIAVIGPPGAGKSSLLAAVAGLRTWSGGAVLVDGRPAEAAVRRIAHVGRNPALVTGSIAENLRWGRADADEDELWEALRICSAEGFVAARPERLQTRIGAGGAGLSGGQRQRIALARAVLRRADLYVLDDCFAALDPACAAHVWRSLRAHLPGATIVAATGRAAFVRETDVVVVVSGGRIQDAGHAAEVARRSAYLATLLGIGTAGTGADVRILGDRTAVAPGDAGWR